MYTPKYTLIGTRVKYIQNIFCFNSLLLRCTRYVIKMVENIQRIKLRKNNLNCAIIMTVNIFKQ